MPKIKNIIFLLICLFIITKNDIIQSPKIVVNNAPIFYIFLIDNYYCIYLSDYLFKYHRITGDSDPLDFELDITTSSLWILDEQNNKFLITNSKFYSVEENQYEEIQNVLPSFSISGYIKETSFSKQTYEEKSVCNIEENEIILYGKSDDNLFTFSFIKQQKEFTYEIRDLSNLNCKAFSNGQYLCAILNSYGEVYISFIYYYWTSGGCNSDIKEIYNLNELNPSTNIQLYDTSIPEKKLLCVVNSSNNITCLLLTINTTINLTPEFAYIIEYQKIDILINMNGNLNDCAFNSNIVNNEALFCCGGRDSIQCRRIDNKNFISKNMFTISFSGIFSKLFIFSDNSDYIDILFKKAPNSVYKYSIYKPNCNDFNYTTFIYNSGISKNINELFERKTDTSYYIKFINIPYEYGKLLVNEQQIENNTDKILLNTGEDFFLQFSSNNNKTINDFPILFNIIIEETFSSECAIYLNILPCYDSCEKCTKSIEESDSQNHNCEEGQCKTNYYPSPITSTNCYKEEEKETNWYLDTNEKKFKLCNSLCASCSGPNSDNCLSCHSFSTDPEHAFLYNNKCLNECPEGKYALNQSEGYYLCINCYKNCETCYAAESYNDTNKLINMSCLSCKKDIDPNNENNLLENKILIDSNCFPITTYTEEKIIFNISELGIEETEKSCFDYDKAIIYGEYKCITKELNYFYVLNNNENTGVIKICNELCESCYGEKNQITQDTNCINCIEGYYKTEDSNTNCILESLIPQNYIKNNSDNVYYKCHKNCKKCIDFYDANTNNMNCLECINEHFFVHETNNCYNISFVNENAYYFSEEDNKFHKCYFSCSRCSQPELDEFNHNCIKCQKDFYMIYNTNDTNCYNDTILEGGYYLDIYTINENEEPTYKKCYEKCKTCINTKVNNNMNCLICNDGYYKLNGTNNCFDESLLEIGFYFKNDMFYPCDESCETCSGPKTITNGIISSNCLSCDITSDLYFVIDLNNCEPESFKEKGYYLKSIQKDDYEIQYFYKCYDTCSLCDKDGELDSSTNNYIHNCLKCKDNYYPLKTEERNCYSKETIGEGFFLNKSYTIFKWEKCYEKCATCSAEGNEEKMRCLSCKTNYINKEYNKLVYLKLIKENCIISCSDNLFLTKELDCVSSCPSGTYEYAPNKTCLDECPYNFKINEENTKCIFTTFKNETTSSDFKEIVFSNISFFVDAFKVVKGYDFLAQIIASKDIAPIEQIKNGISGLDLGDCIEELKGKYNISENEDLIVVETETKEDKSDKNNNKDSIDIGKDVKVTITDINGNILNMSYCQNDIKVMKYIGDNNEININTAEDFAEKGVDVFNASDEFFNDKCKYYDHDVDIIIKDRREDIFQNVNFCGDKCAYNGMNYSLNIAICSCDSTSLQEDDEENDEKLNLHNFANSFKSEIFSFNYDVIKCFNLVYNLKILKNNVGFYTNIAFVGLQIGALVYFLLKKIKPIQSFMIKFEENKFKGDNSNPPPKFSDNDRKSNNDIKKLNLNNKLKIKKINDNYNRNQEQKTIEVEQYKNIDDFELNNNININKVTEEDLINTSNLNKNEKEPKIKFINGKTKIKRKIKKKIKTYVLKNPKYNFDAKKENTNNLDIKNDNRVNRLSHLKTTTDDLVINNKRNNANRRTINHLHNKLKMKEEDKISCRTINSKEKQLKSDENIDSFKIEGKKKFYITPNEEYADMDFDEALKSDKRTFFQIYKSNLLEEHIIFNTFCTEVYLELRAVKISFLFFGYEINFFLNAFFYSDEYISDTYHNNGILDFASSLPKSIYSFIVTIILSTLLKMLSNSKKQLSKIMNEKKTEKEYLEALEKELNRLDKKLMVYYIIVFVLGILFAYYATSFCAVYRNSQIYWFIGCIESSAMDFITPFLICLLLAGLRFISILKKYKCIYKMSSLLATIL